MSTYKVIQDIEAEDKLIGPLTMRQALYAGIAVMLGFITFKLAMNAPWLALPFLPPIALFLTLAAPFGHDQSSEIWLLAKVRFFLKPRRRIWDQSGASQLVTITAPKHIERQLTNNLTKTEVRSRLRALANTIDSRGWAIKNVNVNLYAQPGYIGANDSSDRLLNSANFPQEVPNYEVSLQDDMLDERNNPTAQHLQQMIEQSTQAHRQAVITKMQHSAQPLPTTQTAQPADYWFLSQPATPQAPPPGLSTFGYNSAITPGQTDAPHAPAAANPTSEEEAFIAARRHQQGSDPRHNHLKTILPLSEQRMATPPPQTTQKAADTTVTAKPDPAILSLASNDDLSVATIAKEANQSKARKIDDQGEVVISLR